MDNLELKEGTDSTLHQMAGKMNAEQMKDIAALDSFLLAHKPTNNDARFSVEALTEMNNMQIEADKQSLNGNIDHDFATLMIQHHQGAINLSESELRYGTVRKLREMAQMSIQMQGKEIEDLQKWLTEH
jgi:uncharacterized protein (DUF305 family)